MSARLSRNALKRIVYRALVDIRDDGDRFSEPLHGTFLRCNSSNRGVLMAYRAYRAGRRDFHPDGCDFFGTHTSDSTDGRREITAHDETMAEFLAAEARR